MSACQCEHAVRACQCGELIVRFDAHKTIVTATHLEPVYPCLKPNSTPLVLEVEESLLQRRRSTRIAQGHIQTLRQVLAWASLATIADPAEGKSCRRHAGGRRLPGPAGPLAVHCPACLKEHNLLEGVQWVCCSNIKQVGQRRGSWLCIGGAGVAAARCWQQIGASACKLQEAPLKGQWHTGKISHAALTGGARPLRLLLPPSWAIQ